MTDAVLSGLGGIGLFLLGMLVMTDGLRTVAGAALRRFLARFSRSPFKGVMSGTLTTAAIQSSSATTVAAVGFVNARLLTFPQAVGIVLGANIGTTITGWLVALLGFKLDLGQLALPLILVGALMRLFASPRAAGVGQALAGFGLIFVGIEVLQTGMEGAAAFVTPDSFPDDTLVGRLALVGLGLLLTVITQSSSAGVATALTAVHAGTIGVRQAAAMVIGMDVGTTVTAVIAAIGGSTAARRTGAAHVAYNLLTGTGAFLLLDPYFAVWERFGPTAMSNDPEIVVVAFHTVFNLIAVTLVLPGTRRFAQLIERMVPHRGTAWTSGLDNQTLRDPAIALAAARGALAEYTADMFDHVVGAIRGRAAGPSASALAAGLRDVRRYLGRIAPPRGAVADRERLAALLHAVDHLDRMLDRVAATERIETLRRRRALRRAGATLARRLLEGGAALRAHADAEPTLRVTWNGLAQVTGRYRSKMLARVAAGDVSSETGMAQLDAVRWLRRMAYHGWRIAHHLTRSDPRRRTLIPETVATIDEAEAPELA